MSAMTAARVEHVGLGRGLGMGVDRRASGGRASAVPRARRRAVIARVQGAEGERTAVKRERSAFRADTHARGTARVRPMRALGGSFDETDPETALKASSETVEEASEGEGSMTEVALWVGAATLFGLGVGATMGAGKAEEYFSGYLLEQSLSVDNLFVFVLVFDYFKVPMKQQQKVLSYGIGGAMAMRAAMIVAGYEAVTNFKPVLLVFAGILIFSSYKLITEEEEEEEDMSENAIVKFCSNLLPVSEEYDGDNFFTEVRNDETGEMIKMATPLLLCLCVIELSDVVFAVDSIPAVFGVTQDPFIVYSSNIFAILGLRSLFAFVAVMVAELEYLQTAVAAVLGFVGCKMVAEFGGVEVSTEASLAVVVGMLGAGVALSLAKKDDEEEGK
jgi:TerC family integral membrane protein